MGDRTEPRRRVGAAPALRVLLRVHPSSDGTSDAPIDTASNRLFTRIAIAMAAAGGALLIAAIVTL